LSGGFSSTETGSILSSGSLRILSTAISFTCWPTCSSFGASGSSSKENLNSLDPVQDRYVTAVRPSDHKEFLAAAAEQLEDVKLENETVVRAWRTRRVIAGQQRDTVVVYSTQLHQGQRRGLHQSLARYGKQLEEMGLRPETTVETAKRKLAKLRGRQYLRTVACSEVTAEAGQTRVRVWSDLEEYRRLTTRYFGLRILITDRSEWTELGLVASRRYPSRGTAIHDWNAGVVPAAHPLHRTRGRRP